MRKFLIGLVALVVIAVGAALVVPSFIDWNRYKGEIAARAEEATGRKLTIAGNLDLALLPAPRLSVRDVRFANIPGGSAPDMARLKSLDVQVRLWPLLQGRIEVDSVTLVEPAILLEKLADGRVNWDIAASKAGAATKNGAPGTAPGGAGGGAPAIQLDQVRIERGTLTWRDAASGTEEKITDLTVDLAARSVRGPFRVKGGFTARGIPLEIDAALGALKPETASSISLMLALPSADARAEISGSLAPLAEQPRFTGKLDARGKDLGRVLSAVSGAAAPPLLAQPFRLRASLGGTSAAASVENLDAELGSIRASGGAKATLGAAPRVDANLRLTRINLDALLTDASPAATPAKPAPEPATPADTAAKPFSLPGGIDATLALGIDAVTWHRQSVRDISIDARLAGGQIALTRAAMLLPGGGEASLDGRLAAVGGRPTFEGKVSSQIDDFRSLLDWVGVDVGAVPSDRLRKFSVAATVRGNDEQIQLRNGQLSLDTTRTDFATTVVMRKRPAFGLTLNIGDVNLDAYLPRPGAAGNAARPAGKPAPADKPAAKGAPPPGPLAALNGFDANVVLRVASLTYNRTPVRDLRFNGTLSNGRLIIRKASVANFGGAHGEIAGTLSNFASFPVFKGTVAADARDIAGVLRLAGLKPPAMAKSLGAVKLRGTADASADQASFDLKLNAVGGAAQAVGKLSDLQAAPRFDGTFLVRHNDLAALIRALGADPGKAKLGALAINLTAKGDLKGLSVRVKSSAAGLTVAANGSVDGLLSGPVFKLSVSAKHPSTLAFARLFLPDYTPAQGRIGPFSLNAALNGSQSLYNLVSLKVNAGKLALGGTGKLATGGERPALTAALKAGVIDLNPFRPRKKGGAALPGGKAAAGATAPGERFSSEKFDTAALGLLDADLSIGASALIWSKYRVDNPTIKTTLADRLLTVSEVSGRMFDGAFKLNGRLNGRTVPAVDGTVTVAKANVGKALFETGTFDITGGITDFSMNAAARGASPRAMVSALNGSGRIASVNGVVKGFDLKAVSDRLKNLDRALDFLSLFGSAMGGGQTKFSRLDGSFTIKNGVVRTDDVKLQADAGLGTARGFADLPRWNMDFTSQFRLTEHPKAPPFGMRVVGPIDNPKRLFQFKDLQTYLLQRGVGTLLRKAFPGKIPGSAPSAPAPQQQQPAKPRIEDILPGLLKGLGK